MNGAEFIKFVEAVLPNVLHIRVISQKVDSKEENGFKNMVWLQFKDQESADLFYRDYNGLPFNSFGVSMFNTSVYIVDCVLE